ncbi:MAG: 2-oxoacid:acceptor oxidoreductase family protein [Candidatus Aminicenantaceae bacterium]
MKQYNLAFSGLGGQGVMTVSQVLAAAAAHENVQVLVFEGTGISQRGGGVFSFVRFGESYSPKIPIGGADALISLEISEIIRIIKYLKPQGQIWTNSGTIHGYYTKLRPELYPMEDKIKEMTRLKTDHLYMIPARRLAQEAGSAQAVNMTMLGAFSSENSILNMDSITRAIEESSKKFAEVNLKAFWNGYNFAKNEGIPE